MVAAFWTLAEPAVALMGGEGRTAEMAASYLRISALGIPFALVALSGSGYLRVVSDLRTPLVFLVAGNAVNVVLEVWFVRWMLVAGLGVGVPLGLVALALDWGVVGVWIALNGFLLARLVSLGLRFAGGRWAVTGAAVTA